MEETEKKAWSKIIAGSIIGLVGLAGMFFGKTLRQRTIRLSVFGVSAISLIAGGYLLISGVTDLGIGVAGQYQLDGPAQQTLRFPGPDYFKMALRSASQNKDLRRLEFNCPDGSKSFTVYFTKLGTFGIPQKSVICKDGFRLIDYDPSIPFAMEQ